MPAITDARWQLAQKCEAEYWAGEAKNPTKLAADIADGHHFTAGVLDIRPATVGGKVVLDIAGGPYPLVGETWFGIGSAWVLDPMHYPADASWMVSQIFEKAEGFETDIAFDEAIGYNVLQHVVDPAEVMATARRCAERVIRWFDVVDTPIYPVHPHSISADWLRQQLSRDGFRITRDIDGSRLVEGHRQKFVALVAERA